MLPDHLDGKFSQFYRITLLLPGPVVQANIWGAMHNCSLSRCMDRVQLCMIELGHSSECNSLHWHLVPSACPCKLPCIETSVHSCLLQRMLIHGRGTVYCLVLKPVIASGLTWLYTVHCNETSHPARAWPQSLTLQFARLLPQWMWTRSPLFSFFFFCTLYTIQWFTVVYICYNRNEYFPTIEM